ncbi:MAG: ABC transporter substrate-binding protein [Suipraeoptans sp.]
MKRRIIASLLVTVMVLAAALTGCGNSGGGEVTETSSDEDVTISFSWWGSDDRHAAMQEVVALYEAENPNVTIDVVYGAWDGWQTKMLTQLSGKTESDVMQVNYNWVHSFGKGSNVFYDLNELADYIDLSNWDSDYLKAMEVGGEQGAVPHGMTGRVQVVNNSIFEEAGIEYPKTYEEMIEAAAIIGADNTATGADNKYVGLNIGKECTDLYIAQMLYNATGKTMQTDGTVNYTEDEVAAVFDQYIALEEAGALPKFEQDDPIQNESNPVWTGGRAGAVYEWAGTLDKYTGSFQGGGHDDELIIQGYVTEDGSDPTVYVKPNLGYAVSKNSKYPDVAADFVNFMFTNEEAVKTLGTSLGISSNTVTNGIQEAEGMITGKVAEAYELLNSYDQTVMDPYFEDENVRGTRYVVIEGLRSGKYDSSEAAAKYIADQQEELDKLYD